MRTPLVLLTLAVACAATPALALAETPAELTEHVLGYLVPLEQIVGLEAVEAEDLPWPMMRQDASPEQVDGEGLADR